MSRQTLRIFANFPLLKIDVDEKKRLSIDFSVSNTSRFGRIASVNTHRRFAFIEKRERREKEVRELSSLLLSFSRSEKELFLNSMSLTYVENETALFFDD